MKNVRTIKLEWSYFEKHWNQRESTGFTITNIRTNEKTMLEKHKNKRTNTGFIQQIIGTNEKGLALLQKT